MTDLQKRAKEAFGAEKKRLGFKSSFEDVDGIFYVLDFVESEGFVSSKFSRALCRRITNLLWNWNNYLHNLVVPNPNSMVMVAESQMFDDKRRAQIIDIMNSIMALVARNSLIGLSDDASEEARFIDDGVALWHELQPRLVDVLQHVCDEWKTKASEVTKVDEQPRHP